MEVFSRIFHDSSLADFCRLFFALGNAPTVKRRPQLGERRTGRDRAPGLSWKRPALILFVCQPLLAAGKRENKRSITWNLDPSPDCCHADVCKIKMFMRELLGNIPSGFTLAHPRVSGCRRLRHWNPSSPSVAVPIAVSTWSDH